MTYQEQWLLGCVSHVLNPSTWLWALNCVVAWSVVAGIAQGVFGAVSEFQHLRLRWFAALGTLRLTALAIIGLACLLTGDPGISALSFLASVALNSVAGAVAYNLTHAMRVEHLARGAAAATASGTIGAERRLSFRSADRTRSRPHPV